MKLLVEVNDQEVECFSESVKGGGKKYYIEGKWAAVDEEVKNGRTYPRDVMEGALNKYHEGYISQKRAMGELNHPQGPTVNLDRVSHLIENLRIEGNGVVGRARVLESTPMGAIASALIDEGVKLGVSTRGLGSIVERDGRKYVANDFMLSAIDIVSDPSGPGCYVSGLRESIDYQMLEDGRIVELVVAAKKNKINEAKFLKEFGRLMVQLKG